MRTNRTKISEYNKLEDIKNKLNSQKNVATLDKNGQFKVENIDNRDIIELKGFSGIQGKINNEIINIQNKIIDKTTAAGIASAKLEGYDQEKITNLTTIVNTLIDLPNKKNIYDKYIESEKEKVNGLENEGLKNLVKGFIENKDTVHENINNEDFKKNFKVKFNEIQPTEEQKTELENKYKDKTTDNLEEQLRSIEGTIDSGLDEGIDNIIAFRASCNKVKELENKINNTDLSIDFSEIESNCASLGNDYENKPQLGVSNLNNLIKSEQELVILKDLLNVRRQELEEAKVLAFNKLNKAIAADDDITKATSIKNNNEFVNNNNKIDLQTFKSINLEALVKKLNDKVVEKEKKILSAETIGDLGSINNYSFKLTKVSEHIRGIDNKIDKCKESVTKAEKTIESNKQSLKQFIEINDIEDFGVDQNYEGELTKKGVNELKQEKEKIDIKLKKTQKEYLELKENENKQIKDDEEKLTAYKSGLENNIKAADNSEVDGNIDELSANLDKIKKKFEPFSEVKKIDLEQQKNLKTEISKLKSQQKAVDKQIKVGLFNKLQQVSSDIDRKEDRKQVTETGFDYDEEGNIYHNFKYGDNASVIKPEDNQYVSIEDIDSEQIINNCFYKIKDSILDIEKNNSLSEIESQINLLDKIKNTIYSESEQENEFNKQKKEILENIEKLSLNDDNSRIKISEQDREEFEHMSGNDIAIKIKSLQEQLKEQEKQAKEMLKAATKKYKDTKKDAINAIKNEKSLEDVFADLKEIKVPDLSQDIDGVNIDNTLQKAQETKKELLKYENFKKIKNFSFLKEFKQISNIKLSKRNNTEQKKAIDLRMSGIVCKMMCLGKKYGVDARSIMPNDVKKMSKEKLKNLYSNYECLLSHQNIISKNGVEVEKLYQNRQLIVSTMAYIKEISKGKVIDDKSLEDVLKGTNMACLPEGFLKSTPNKSLGIRCDFIEITENLPQDYIGTKVIIKDANADKEDKFRGCSIDFFYKRDIDPSVIKDLLSEKGIQGLIEYGVICTVKNKDGVELSEEELDEFKKITQPKRYNDNLRLKEEKRRFKKEMAKNLSSTVPPKHAPIPPKAISMLQKKPAPISQKPAPLLKKHAPVSSKSAPISQKPAPIPPKPIAIQNDDKIMKKTIKRQRYLNKLLFENNSLDENDKIEIQKIQKIINFNFSGLDCMATRNDAKTLSTISQPALRTTSSVNSVIERK